MINHGFFNHIKSLNFKGLIKADIWLNKNNDDRIVFGGISQQIYFGIHTVPFVKNNTLYNVNFQKNIFDCIRPDKAQYL